ncbi:MAG: C-GCAxxG-C-C family protein [Desulfobacterales bacterium]|nr:C-GCAxxG-C-C family protein [Desulfobacterales bacterium]
MDLYCLQRRHRRPAGSAMRCGIRFRRRCLGLRHRWPLADKQRVKQERLDAREDAPELVTSFLEKFGAITCLDLIGMDFSKPDVYRQFLEAGIWKDKCLNYVQFVIEKLYELDGSASSR